MPSAGKDEDMTLVSAQMEPYQIKEAMLGCTNTAARGKGGDLQNATL